MVLTVLGTVGLLVAMGVGVPLLAYGLSALLDGSRRGGEGGGEGRGGVPVRPPGPPGPPTSMTRSAESKDRDGTVS
jgi:hypothetical protein